MGIVPGVSAHASMRLEGICAIDRYIPIHEALWEYERRINSEREESSDGGPGAPVSGRRRTARGGAVVEPSPGQAPLRGRVGVRVGRSAAGAKAAFEEVFRGACPEAEISWGGGKFAPAETPTDHPLVEVVGTALARELGRPPELCGFPGGVDMRLFTARGIPCVMVGTNGIELAHAVNERVSVEDVYKLACVLARSLVRLQFGDEPRADP